MICMPSGRDVVFIQSKETRDRLGGPAGGGGAGGAGAVAPAARPNSSLKLATIIVVL